LEALLNGGIQPLPDLAPEEFDGLRRSVGKGPLADPLSITSDGLLIDGHQRARALMANGRKFIDAGEVRVIPDATADNALDWAVRLNVTRRHLTTEAKAELARKLQSERGWSQARIAQCFGVSRPAVSQWLAKHRSDGDELPPPVILGVDGKRYLRDEQPQPTPEAERPPRSLWRPDGTGYKALKRSRTLLEHEAVDGLDSFYAAKLRAELEDLVSVAEGVISQLTERYP
jgi:predicted XRE-type DNA-binding protein